MSLEHSSQNAPADDEDLVLVDEKDCELGIVKRSAAHAHGLLHRAVHVLLFDSCGRVLLQRRSTRKEVNPRLWTSSASGHVAPGESYEVAALRELAEELGANAPRQLEFVGKDMVTARSADQNFVCRAWTALFVAKYDGDPQHLLANTLELAAVELFDLSTVVKAVCGTTVLCDSRGQEIAFADNFGQIINLWQRKHA